MDLINIYEKQLQDIERFKVLRDNAWQQVKTDNEKLAAAFGGKENLSGDALKTYQSRINSFNAEWSMEGGSRYNALQNQHEKQIQQVTGNKKTNTSSVENSSPRKEKTDDTTKQKFKNQSEHITDKKSQANNQSEKIERERLREKTAKIQAAIKARKMEKKRSR